uniref:glycogenin glucosyltransferase n=3 Tax=Lygus hesperus TaxID=30085 RepID=A0A0A9XQS4_LYGHE
MSNTGQAWVTLATNDSYALGALVLAQSLKRNNTIHQLAVLITPGVSPAMREALSSAFDVVKEVDVLDSQDAANLALLARPDLGVTFTKLHCWNLTQYTKCVFLDADTLVIKNCDELFERDELSAAPDAGWPDCFNSGVFVFIPSENTFKSLLDFALTHGSFDGGDQGLLNMFFGDWATSDITKHLPFVYNMVATATYSYLPAFKAFGGNVKIAHFIGSSKPWLQALPGGTTLSNFLDLWWDIFLKDVSKKLNTNMGGLAGALAGGQRDVIEDQFRKQSWEQGNIDYMGKDAFENIWKKMSETVEDIKPLEKSAPETSSPQEESVPASAPETPKTEDKTDSSKVEIQQTSTSSAETSQPEAEQPHQEAPKTEAIPETPKLEGPQEPSMADKLRSEETQKEVSEQKAPPAEVVAAPPAEVAAAPPAEVAAAPPSPDAKQEAESGISAAPIDTPGSDQAAAPSTPQLPVAAEVPVPLVDVSVPAAPTESLAKDPAPPAEAPQPPAEAPQPPIPTAEPSSPPQAEPASEPITSTPPPPDKKGPSPPKEDSKPPKDGGAEKLAEPIQEAVAPASPSVPSPASPSAPEGAKIDAAQAPLPPDPQTPTPETSTPPQTPVGDAPVPPKRSSKKGKAKK